MGREVELIVSLITQVAREKTVRPDGENTQCALDVTDFVKWAVGQNPEFSNADPKGSGPAIAGAAERPTL